MQLVPISVDRVREEGVHIFLLGHLVGYFILQVLHLVEVDVFLEIFDSLLTRLEPLEDLLVSCHCLERHTLLLKHHRLALELRQLLFHHLGPAESCNGATVILLLLLCEGLRLVLLDIVLNLFCAHFKVFDLLLKLIVGFHHINFRFLFLGCIGRAKESFEHFDLL